MDPTETDLTDFLNDHFCYEVEELIGCYAFFVSSFQHRKELEERGLYVAIQNTGIDHFMMHGRNLLEFFFYKPNNDYARASFYITGWEATPQKTENIKELERRVNFEGVHLGWRRLLVKPDEKNWKPLLIIKDFLNTTEFFLSNVDPRYKGQRVQTLLLLLEQCKTQVQDIFGSLLRPRN